MEKEKLYELRYYANSLENGIDPTTGLAFSEDTIMNAPKIKEYNRQMRELLDSFIFKMENYRVKTNIRKIPFYISQEEKKNFTYLDKSVSISQFCYEINETLIPGMSKLHAKDLTKGLEAMGYLETKPLGEEKSYKCPTEKGLRLGITSEKKVNAYGNEYCVNLYNKDAQRFVMEHLEEILGGVIYLES